VEGDGMVGGGGRVGGALEGEDGRAREEESERREGSWK
jgi:hypothetical protein